MKIDMTVLKTDTGGLVEKSLLLELPSEGNCE